MTRSFKPELVEKIDWAGRMPIRPGMTATVEDVDVPYVLSCSNGTCYQCFCSTELDEDGNPQTILAFTEQTGFYWTEEELQRFKETGEPLQRQIKEARKRMGVDYDTDLLNAVVSYPGSYADPEYICAPNYPSSTHMSLGRRRVEEKLAAAKAEYAALNDEQKKKVGASVQAKIACWTNVLIQIAHYEEHGAYNDLLTFSKPSA